MGLKIAIVDSDNRPVLDYPMERFLWDFVAQVRPLGLCFRTAAGKQRRLLEIANQLLNKFKQQTVRLPACHR